MPKNKQQKALSVIAGAPDKPLKIGEIEINCYVLENEARVISQNSMANTLNLNSRSLRGFHADAELPRFASTQSLSPFISDELKNALTSPILFKNPSGGGMVHGYPATILVDICKAVWEAKEAGKLSSKQTLLAARCNILIMGLASIGIIGLIDEATGYQEIRAKNALAAILERYIEKEFHSWTKTFPEEFYKQIFRLNGWGSFDGIGKPAVIGHYTNDVVYDRLAPGILKELRTKNPKLPTGRRKTRHHQWFTSDAGHPKLKEHIEGVTALMKVSKNWTSFKRLLDRAYPKYGDTIQLNLEDSNDE